MGGEGKERAGGEGKERAGGEGKGRRGGQGKGRVGGEGKGDEEDGRESLCSCKNSLKYGLEESCTTKDFVI